MQFVVVLITASTEAEAAKIARALVGEHLAGCVNILPRVRSLYWWQGKVQDDREALMVVKTRKALLRRLKRRVKELHSYSVPEVIALPLQEGSEEYLRWLAQATSANPKT
jgi:periplasmic divalent cation tolerance protein